MTWTPLGQPPRDPAVLVDGIPDWMHSSVAEWLRAQFTGQYGSSDSARVRRMQVDMRDPRVEQAFGHGPSRFLTLLAAELRLPVVDWVVMDNGKLRQWYENRALNEILTAGGSVWKVGTRAGVSGLEQRVPDGVRVAAEDAMTLGDAGQLLTQAWAAAFGINPDPSKAYGDAIKAVETAAAPVVSPNDSKATLGKMLTQMRNQSQGGTGWSLPLAGKSAAVPIDMVEALWTGQTNRHGGGNHQPISQKQAETAVLLAVPLVHWFSSGAITRR